MADSGYVCNKAGLTFGRKTLYPGMPVPPSEVTPLLLKLEWVKVATTEEYAAAVKEYGEPPDRIEQPGDWEYRKKGAATTLAGEAKPKKKRGKKGAAATTPAGE